MRQQLATQRQMGAGRGRGRVGNFALATTPVRAGGEGMIPNFAPPTKAKGGGGRPYPAKYPMIVPYAMSAGSQILAPRTNFEKGGKRYTGVQVPTGGRKPNLAQSDDNFLLKEEGGLKSEVSKSLSSLAVRYANTMIPLTKANTPSQQQMAQLLDGQKISVDGKNYQAKGAKGALMGAVGSTFEAATSLSLGLALGKMSGKTGS